MTQQRKTGRPRNSIDLPGNTWPDDAFFDEQVQKVLEKRRTPPEDLAGFGRVEYKAWPLMAFFVTQELVGAIGDTSGKHGMEFPDYFVHDPEWMAELLFALTHYATLPREQWPMRRALQEVLGPIPESAIRALTNGEPLTSDDQKAVEWKDAQLVFEREFPHLAENLAKKAMKKGKPAELRLETRLANERRIRLKILDLWEPNFQVIDDVRLQQRWGRRFSRIFR